jgi:hypothetical protein
MYDLRTDNYEDLLMTKDNDELRNVFSIGAIPGASPLKGDVADGPAMGFLHRPPPQRVDYASTDSFWRAAFEWEKLYDDANPLRVRLTNQQLADSIHYDKRTVEHMRDQYGYAKRR